jgi:hypothetical protein
LPFTTASNRFRLASKFKSLLWEGSPCPYRIRTQTSTSHVSIFDKLHTITATMKAWITKPIATCDHRLCVPSRIASVSAPLRSLADLRRNEMGGSTSARALQPGQVPKVRLLKKVDDEISHIR